MTAYIEKIAKQFHESYERLAPSFGYKTKEESAVPWENVPPNNKALMRAVVEDLMERGCLGGVWRPIESAPKDGTWVMGYWETMPITQYPCICFADRCFSNPNAFETIQSNEYGSEEVYPTHWMPLPPPPQKDEV